MEPDNSADAESIAALCSRRDRLFHGEMSPEGVGQDQVKGSKLGVSANAFFRYGAELALLLNDRELVRFAVARAAEAKGGGLPEARS